MTSKLNGETKNIFILLTYRAWRRSELKIPVNNSLDDVKLKAYTRKKCMFVDLNLAKQTNCKT